MKNSAEKVPLLKDTLRKLYLRTHPDLFGQHPKQQEQNEASYKELLGILDSIEKNNEFPPAKTLVLPFSLKTPVDGVFKEVSLHLRTTGGACNTLVEEALGKFFVECGLPGVFQWGEGSWGKALGKDKVQNSNLDFEKEDEEAKKREEIAAKEKAEREAKYSAPAYNPVDRKAPEDNSIERILNELNDVFEIIAAVPLMDEEEYGELRVYYEKGQGLDEIEARGYSIKAGTKMIWEGERDLNVLTKGIDADSAMIIQRILLHTLAIEQKVKELIESGHIDPEDVASDDEDEEVATTSSETKTN
ncbi:putative mitochondrial protein, partial [Globisporangium splendens]